MMNIIMTITVIIPPAEPAIPEVPALPVSIKMREKDKIYLVGR